MSLDFLLEHSTSSHHHQHHEEAAAQSHFFEGPEKRLEVIFSPANAAVATFARSEGLRSYNSERWQELLNYAKCTIISERHNDHFDAYVLSESSLFVYPTKAMLKTCGGTTLLRVIPKLLEYAAAVGLVTETVVYSRKNYLRPQRQESPHHDFNAEVDFLQQSFPEAAGGQAYTFGSITAEHWNLFVADCRPNSGQPSSPRETRAASPSTSTSSTSNARAPATTVEIMMHQLDRYVCSRFFGKRENRDLPEVNQLIPGSELDQFHFEPCGYSMNALFNDSFSTIHVTPEPDFSYASYETSLILPNYNALISAVLDLFRPAVVTISILDHQTDTFERSRNDRSLRLPDYSLRNHTVTELEGGKHVHLWNFRLTEQLQRSGNSSPRPELNE